MDVIIMDGAQLEGFKAEGSGDEGSKEMKVLK